MADKSTLEESGHTHALLMQRYASRLSPEQAEVLRAAVEAVVRTVSAVRAVPLSNGEAPLLGFAPVRKEA